MSNLALMEVQRALYNKLAADGVLMGMVSGVYDIVPQRTPLPYIRIGDGDQKVTPADALNVSECKLDLHVWTDVGGRKTALAIMNRLHALIHLGTLTLSGFQRDLAFRTGDDVAGGAGDVSQWRVDGAGHCGGGVNGDFNKRRVEPFGRRWCGAGNLHHAARRADYAVRPDTEIER